ncbi:unnamed protein product [Calypogeia fissa]
MMTVICSWKTKGRDLPFQENAGTAEPTLVVCFGAEILISFHGKIKLVTVSYKPGLRIISPYMKVLQIGFSRPWRE